MSGHGGNTRGKDAVLQKWIRKDTGKIASLKEHVTDLCDIYTTADPNIITKQIRYHNTYWGHKFERIGQC